MNSHKKYIQRCIQLAKNGLGTTYPNPLVGSVIVFENQIIGEGWHYQAGDPHAEVCAIESVVDPTLLPHATIYVSLEPCSHFGKTPPCADLIIKTGIKSVVIGCTDPNPKVSGQGVKRLMEAGCDVVLGVLEDECLALNKRFFTFQLKKRPFVTLKWAQTPDGFLAPLTKDTNAPVWISNEFSQQLSHKLRAQEQAILVGTQTVLDDNPTLTTRNWAGAHPLRVVIDRTLRIPEEAAVLSPNAATLIVTEDPQKSAKNPCVVLDFSKELPRNILKELADRGIQSVIVEGGAKTLQSFIDGNAWDEALVFEGDVLFEQGIAAPRFQGIKISEKRITTNLLRHYKNPTV